MRHHCRMTSTFDFSTDTSDSQSKDQSRFDAEKARLSPGQTIEFLSRHGEECSEKDYWNQFPEHLNGIEPPTSLEFVHDQVGTLDWGDRFGNKFHGVTLLPTYRYKTGVPHRRVDVLFIMPCVLDADIDSRYSPAAMLKGKAANLFARNLGRAGLADCCWDFTTLVRYPIKSNRPKANDINWARPLFYAEINRLRPRIIVAMGKAVFENLYTAFKINLQEYQGGVFNVDAPEILQDDEWSPKLMIMDQVSLTFSRPELIERCLVDLENVKYELTKLKEPESAQVLDVRTDYQVIETAEHLGNWIGDMQRKKVLKMAIDAEWAGKHFVDGQLRSFQSCWDAGQVTYIKFLDENGKKIMPLHTKQVGDIMRPVFEAPGFQYIGHNFPADAVWIETHLGLSTYRRLFMDTMFVQQLINEYSDLKLERLAVRYTRLGRYDVALKLWKKENHTLFNESDGYGKIPDRLLIPYACKDVDVTWRVHPILLNQLIAQGPKLLQYWLQIARGFTSDCYISKMLTGLPIDQAYADKLREVYHSNLVFLQDDFKRQVIIEADETLLKALSQHIPGAAPTVLQILKVQRSSGLPVSDMVRFTQASVGAAWAQDTRLHACFEHWCEIDSFNYGSPDHLRRWMFDVKGLMPIKTTKRDGVTMSWEKVLKLDPDKQKDFTPAADKQTLKIYENVDPMLAYVGQLKSVATMCKTFLRDKDEDGEERGIHSWIASDGYIHANFASTETGRPRTWNPNILNWPKSVSKPIEMAFKRVNAERANACRARMTDDAKLNGREPDLAVIEEKAREIQFAPVSIRSMVKAPKGECFVDADLVTAEVVGLGYLSGDKNLIAACESPDQQFGILRKVDVSGNVKEKPARICYIEDISRIPKDAQDPSILVPEDHPDLVRIDGKIVHPKRDVHWQMAESFTKMPREKLNKETHRGGGKVGMFSIPYGAKAPLIERNIEVLTGVKPVEGTGAAIITAYETNFVTATQFLNEMALLPSGDRPDLIMPGTPPGCYDSVSGRRRHFKYVEIKDLEGLTEWAKRNILDPMTREARNYPLQEIVAATMARAHIWLLDHYIQTGMKARPMLLLYDALTVRCPLEERFLVRDSLQRYMSDQNVWHVPRSNMKLKFDIEVDFNIRWALDPTPDLRKLLYDESLPTFNCPEV